MTAAPELAIGDGALGFWKAIEEIYPPLATPTELRSAWALARSARHVAPALLGSQDRQRAQQGPEIRSASDEGYASDEGRLAG